MLLLLTLTLLASSACRAQSEYPSLLCGLRFPCPVLSTRASEGGIGPEHPFNASLSDILGNNVGTYFYVRGEDQGELKGMRIFLTAINHIKG